MSCLKSAALQYASRGAVTQFIQSERGREEKALRKDAVTSKQALGAAPLLTAFTATVSFFANRFVARFRVNELTDS
jgi:hypothetical protein